MDFNVRLKQLRQKHKLTQSELADILGLKPTAVSNYESRRNEPSFDKLIALSKYFDVSCDYLLGIITKLNKFFLIGILFLLAIIGTTLTNMIARRIPWIETFYVDEIVTQIFVYIGGAIFFFYLGIISNINKKVINKVQ